MQGFSLSDSYNFDDWQFYQMDALRHQFIDVLARLVRGYGAQGALKSALRYARRWVAVDHLDERAHAQLMRLYIWTGQRSAALRQYEVCERILDEQLDISPKASTVELHRTIREGHPPPPPNASVAESEGRTEASKPRSLLPISTEDAEGEKSFVTVLVADVGASLRRSAGLEPDEDASLMRNFHRIIAEAVGRYGGRIERTLARSVLVLFGTHESDPEVAIRAAFAIRRQIRTLDLRVAVGIDTGEVYLDRSDSVDGRTFSSLGPALDVATDLVAQAGPGQILIGETAYRLTRGAFAFTTLEVAFDDAGEELTAYQVNRLLARPRKARGIEGMHARLVGRDGELNKLRGTLTRALNGDGQIVSLIGDAGVGKSRLVAELRESAAITVGQQRTPIWLEGRCLDLGMPPSYAPFLDILGQYFSWAVWDDERGRCVRIEAVLQEMVHRGTLAQSRAGEIAERLCDLGCTAREDERRREERPQHMRELTFLTIRDFILALCRQQPVALVFEDLHWADDLSLDLIGFLLDRLAGLPLYLLCVYRPVRGHKSTHLGTVAARKCGERYTEIHLRELTGQQTKSLVSSLLTSESPPSSAIGFIDEFAQGNPFYIEELVRSFIDAEILYREDGVWSFRQDANGFALPESVQSVILSRLERLPAELRQVLQIASVIGRVFSRRLLHQVLDFPTALESLIWTLEDQELIYQERTVPQVEYSFRHVLTREAVYRNVLRSHKMALHGQVAMAMEKLYEESLDEVCEQLAYHYDRAGVFDKAVMYRLRAGRKAQQEHADEAAILHLTRGLELIDELPATADRDRRELDLLLALGVSLVFVKGNAAPEVSAVYARARAACDQSCPAPDRFQILMGLRRYTWMRGDLEAVEELGQQLLSIAREMGDKSALARAHLMQGEATHWRGAFGQAREHCAQCLAIRDPEQRLYDVQLYGTDTGTGCMILGAVNLWYLGYPDQALVAANEALVVSQQDPHPFDRSLLFYFASLLQQLRGEVQPALDYATAVVREARERGFALLESWSLVLSGWALVATGEREAGILQMQMGVGADSPSGDRSTRVHHLALVADGYARADEIDMGQQAVAEGLGLMAEQGERSWEAELYRLEGELLLPTGQEADAEAAFRRAIDVARRQGARSWELRAATSLGRLWQQQGRVREAADLVRGVYDWFTEGFDTADFKDAKALLSNLA
jgi:adenylate cyclase